MPRDVIVYVINAFNADIFSTLWPENTVPSKISVDTLWVSKHVVCADTSITAHKSICGPEYFMDNHKEEGKHNIHMLCSRLYHTFLVWLCLKSLGRLSKWFQPGMHCGSSSQILCSHYSTQIHIHNRHICLTSVWNVTCLLTVQNHIWYAVQKFDES
jgi:hypothetical protein